MEKDTGDSLTPPYLLGLSDKAESDKAASVLLLHDILSIMSALHFLFK